MPPLIQREIPTVSKGTVKLIKTIVYQREKEQQLGTTKTRQISLPNSQKRKTDSNTIKLIQQAYISKEQSGHNTSQHNM